MCLGLFYLVDVFFDGYFLNWFDSHYMIAHTEFTENGEEYWQNQLNWTALKQLLLYLMIILSLLWLGSIILVSYIRKKLAMRRQMTQISSMLQHYMSYDIDASFVFPKEYAEISAQATQIKASMQRHEQLLKDEASRKNDLITYLAHDLKTPLTSVIGYLSLLDEAPDMPTEQKAKYVHIALDKAYRLEKLINEFFEITRYNLQQITLEPETIDLHYMLLQMTDEFYPLLTPHGNTITLEAPDNLMIYGDPEKLARVFNNLLKNAISYSYPGTPIQVRAYRLPQAVCIDVQNQGPTIPPHKLNAIFEKFFRLDEARSTSTGGSGLGLAIAKEIVTLHGGTISASSQQETTLFHVALPIPGQK